jgi:hypothetical protein
MKDGKCVRALPELEDIRAIAREQLQMLPQKYQGLTNAPAYPVRISNTLKIRRAQMAKKMTGEKQ